jgi:hypothetical protein
LKWLNALHVMTQRGLIHWMLALGLNAAQKVYRLHFALRVALILTLAMVGFLVYEDIRKQLSIK